VLAATASGAPATAVAPAAVQERSIGDAFRVRPYLQKPAQDRMTVKWVTETATPGTLVVRGPGLAQPARLTSTRSTSRSWTTRSPSRLLDSGSGIAVLD
jgi:hypothetical protein